MPDLKEIREVKEKEIEKLVSQDETKRSFEKLLNQPATEPSSFKKGLKVAGFSVVAEVCEEQDLIQKVHQYSQAGAAAISVPTDSFFLKGNIHHLHGVTGEMKSLHPCPVLQKDFIIHPYQIAQSKMLNASAINLSPKLLQNDLQKLMRIAEHIGLDVIVEIEDEEDLEMAFEAQASILGFVSNDQKFLDINIAQKLASMVIDAVVKIAFTPVETLGDAAILHEQGFAGTLLSDVLKKSNDVQKLISEMNNV